jgi:hypothetical protein
VQVAPSLPSKVVDLPRGKAAFLKDSFVVPIRLQDLLVGNRLPGLGAQPLPDGLNVDPGERLDEGHDLMLILSGLK